MEQERDSKEYAWKYVTADELLCPTACDFIYAKLVGKEAAGEANLYDGENTLGKQIVRLDSGGLWNCECSPPVPVYCRRGLYLGDTATDTVTIDGVLVIWRPRPSEEG